MVKLLELEELPIRIDAHGRWLHGTEPLHPRVERLFARHVVPTAEGYSVQLGFRKAPVHVHDTAFFIRQTRIYADAEDPEWIRGVWLVLSDEASEWLDPSSLMQSSENVLYCRVRRGNMRVPARFGAAHYHELGMFVQAGPNGLGLPIGERIWPLAAYDPQPLAANQAERGAAAND